MPTPSYIVESPVLFMVFNRPETTRAVFNRIRNAKPSSLYIAADGPRTGNKHDEQLCQEVRDIVRLVDWPCRAEFLFRTVNKGCKIAVSEAIGWFFEKENEGIILEDDCLPASSFFYFCDQLLDKYRTDTRIFSITGSNTQHGNLRGGASYYFSRINSIWGWASWRRVWNQYDPGLSRYTRQDAAHFLTTHFSDELLIREWLNIFEKLKEGKIDTWDQQFQFIGFFEQGLCITPNVNLISNRGFGQQGTHTKDAKDPNANQLLGEITEIIHPETVVPNEEADYFLYNQEFRLAEKHRKIEKDKLLRRRVKKWFRNLFNAPAHEKT